jgi:hypothetical protein
MLFADEKAALAFIKHVHAIPGAADAVPAKVPPEEALGPLEPALRERSAIETVRFPSPAGHTCCLCLWYRQRCLCYHSPSLHPE